MSIVEAWRRAGGDYRKLKDRRGEYLFELICHGPCRGRMLPRPSVVLHAALRRWPLVVGIVLGCAAGFTVIEWRVTFPVIIILLAVVAALNRFVWKS